MNTKAKIEVSNEVKTFIEKAVKDKKEISWIRAGLEFNHGVKGKEATALLAELGIGRKTADWTQVNTLEFLGEKPRTEKDLYDTLIKEGAKNELRWINDRNKIRLTLNAVFEKFEPGKFKEALATEALKKKAKEIVNSK